MGILCITLWVALTALAAADDSCPKPADLSPCTCDGEGLNCMGARTLDEVRRAFKAHFKYGGVRSIWLQGTPITNIPADLFGLVKTQQFYIEVNNVTDVDVKAFSASKKTLKTLSLFGNKIANFDFGGLSIYENLGILNLGRNLITSIPDNAFNSVSIGSIILAQNRISHIGKNAFANLRSLDKLELAANALTTLGPLSFASTTHTAGLLISLVGNQISSVSSTAFEGTQPQGVYLSQNKLTSLPYDSFGSLVTKIGQKGGFLELSANPFSCTGCDYSWIVLNKDILHSRLIGFTCKDGRGVSDLTKSGIQCDN